MIRSRLRTLLLGSGAAAAMVAAGLFPTAASASAPPAERPADSRAVAAAGPTGAAAFWSCSIPPGYTYIKAQNTLSCGGPGFRTQYLVQPPADGIWACSTSTGFTYSSVQNTLDCSVSGFRTKYLLRVPTTGIWACSIPSGFTYTSTMNTLDCSVSGFRTKYLLQAF